MFGDLLQAALGRQLVEAHGKQWITLYYVGSFVEDGVRRLIYIAAEVLAEMPAPCSMIFVDELKPAATSKKEGA